jgi:hypothetical protein
MKIPDITISNDDRIIMTSRCRDCDVLPKVAEAGLIYETEHFGRIQIMHNGLKVVADGYYGSWMTNLIKLCKGHHEPQEERIFHEVVKSLDGNASMLELGGYWSFYSLWFLINQPNRRSIVLEPDPSHLKIGRINAEINNLHPEFIHGCVGEREMWELRL